MSTFGDFLTVVHSLKLTLFLKEEEISDFIFSIFTNWLFSLCVCLSSIFQSAYISLLLHVSNISSYLLLKSMAVSPSLTSQAFIESRVCVCVCVYVCVCVDGWLDGCKSGAHVEPISCGEERNWRSMRVKRYYLWQSVKQGSFLRKGRLCESNCDWHS